MLLLFERQVVTIAQSLGRLQREHGLPIDPDENVKLNLNFGLVDVVYEWARGVPFREITQVYSQPVTFLTNVLIFASDAQFLTFILRIVCIGVNGT